MVWCFPPEGLRLSTSFDTMKHTLLLALALSPALALAQPQKAIEMRQIIEAHIAQAETGAVDMTDEMSELEMAGLAEHLRKLGYVE